MDGKMQDLTPLPLRGMALGSERFKSEIERLAGRRVVPMKRGPKPKEKVEFLL
jgi:hypothetical protein